MTGPITPGVTENESLMLVVGWCPGAGPDRFRLEGRVSADMGIPIPDEPITVEEMQNVALAAKAALAKVLRARKRKRGGAR